jgi:hypothetical protein
MVVTCQPAHVRQRATFIAARRVYGARLDSALLSVPGASIILSPPFGQGELRYLSSTAPLIGAGRVR